MHPMKLIDLTGLLRECAGAEDAVDLDGDILDTSFADLGYDSLALLEVASRIENRYQVTLDDELITEMDTPGKYLDLVNAALSAKSA
jgi:act minimal PKS acyl carrier protein